MTQILLPDVITRVPFGFQFHWLREIARGLFAGASPFRVDAPAPARISRKPSGEIDVALDPIPPHDDLLAALAGVHPIQWLRRLLKSSGSLSWKAAAEAHGASTLELEQLHALWQTLTTSGEDRIYRDAATGGHLLARLRRTAEAEARQSLAREFVSLRKLRDAIYAQAVVALRMRAESGAPMAEPVYLDLNLPFFDRFAEKRRGCSIGSLHPVAVGSGEIFVKAPARRSLLDPRLVEWGRAVLAAPLVKHCGDPVPDFGRMSFRIEQNVEERSLERRELDAWNHTPHGRDAAFCDLYRGVSLHLQRVTRDVLPRVYFANPARQTGPLDAAFRLFAATPPYVGECRCDLTRELMGRESLEQAIFTTGLPPDRRVRALNAYRALMMFDDFLIEDAIRMAGSVREINYMLRADPAAVARRLTIESPMYGRAARARLRRIADIPALVDLAPLFLIETTKALGLYGLTRERSSTNPPFDIAA